MILINVLALVALAIATVALMQSTQESGIDGSIRFRDASQAAAIARAGEMSAAVALRRDALKASDVDHLKEPWAAVVQRPVSIAGGSFTLAISDAQARFNLNNLGDVSAGAAMAPAAAVLQIDPAVAARIAAAIQERGPLVSLSQLREFGLDEAAMERLSRLVTILPRPTPINLNTASEELIALLVGDAASARMIAAQRERTGFVAGSDIGAMQQAVPAGTGLTSNFYWVRTTVTIGETTQTLTSLLQRVNDGGGVRVVTVGRWRGAAAPDALPPALP